jgi:hypothetical protein
MSEISSWALPLFTYHVDVNAGDLVTQVVPVIHIDPVRSGVVDTAACRAVPWIIAAALELRENARLSGRGLLEVGVVVENGEVRRETVGAGTFCQIARPTGRVVVDAVYVYIAASADGIIVF